MFADFRGKHVLLLQGPLGPFFQRFARELKIGGAKVTKVNFNGGDLLFSLGCRTISYRGSLAAWPAYARNLLEQQRVDCVFLLGDMRPYHRMMRGLTAEMGIELFVFEEGYLRPEYITLERGGVNGNSPMSSDPEVYRAAEKSPRADILHIGRTFRRSARYAIAYYVAKVLMFWAYPRYRHHRPGNFLYNGLCFVRGGIRKMLFKLTERGLNDHLQHEDSERFFLFPLQVHNDFQFEHSQFEKIEDCIEEVVASFAEHAPPDTKLVVKHHPADRPYRDYRRLLGRLTAAHQVQDRVLYVHDLHLPTLLRNAQGTVVMNSTVGLASVQQNTPTKVLARAVYNFAGLTHQGDLNSFWSDPGEVDRELFNSFWGWLEHYNQANGNFYRKIAGLPNPTGVKWFQELPERPADAPARS